MVSVSPAGTIAKGHSCDAVYLPAVVKCVFGMLDLMHGALFHLERSYHKQNKIGNRLFKKNTSSIQPSSWKTLHFFYGLLGLLQFYSARDWSNVPAEGDESQEEALDGDEDGADGEETPADSLGVSL